MTVGTETGSYSDIADAFDKLFTYAVATTGLFTEITVTTPQNLTNNSPGIGSGTTNSYVVRCLARAGRQFWIRHHVTGGVYTQVSTGGTTTWAAATGKGATEGKMYPFPTGGTYWFFRNNNFIHAVFSTTLSGATVYGHLHLGTIDKEGTWVGGELLTSASYYPPNAQGGADDITSASVKRPSFGGPVVTTSSGTARYPTGHIYAEYNSRTWAALDAASANNTPAADGTNDATSLFGANLGASTPSANSWFNPYTRPDYAPNTFGGRRLGPPVRILLHQNAGDDSHALLGTVPGIRFISMKDMAAGDTINTDWKVFPLTKQGISGVIGSYSVSKDYAIAYRFQ